VASGVHHILIGPDHILFLLGLLLLGGGLRRLALIITAFTVGHSVTLSLAATGLVQIAPRLVEPAIALSIVIVGLDNLLTAPALNTAHSAAVQRDLRPWLAGVFGLIHGFGFATVLLEFGLPRSALGWSLASFNVGVELGQLAIVLPVAALLELLRRHSRYATQWVVRLGSAIVIVAGAWWFVQRVWFTGVSI
jgi:hydrogenase/urease accessory protein HupE